MDGLEGLRDLGRRVAEMQDDLVGRRDHLAAARHRLLATTAARPGPARRTTVRLALIAAGALSTAAILLVVLRLDRPRALTFEIGAVGRPAEVGRWIAAPAEAELPIRFSEGTRIVLGRRARARVTKVDAHGAHIVLERGEARASVRPAAAGRWRIGAGPFDVLVTGTRLKVDWDPGEEKLAVALAEGAVTVSGGILGAGRPLAAGETLRAFGREGYFEVQSGLSAPPSPEPAVAPPPAPDLSAHPPDPVHGAVEAPAWRGLADAGRFADALAAAERNGFARECATRGPSDLLALADAARLGGNLARSRGALSALRRRFPGDERASIAAFGLGRIAFEGSGAGGERFREAARWFETYLREQPAGPLARDALGRLMEATNRGGDRDGARRAARSYLDAYPDGPHAGLARSIASAGAADNRREP